MDWFRMYGDMPNDPKIGTLSDAEFRTWVELLCMACKEEQEGSTGLTAATVNWALRRNVTETLQKLIETKLILIDDADVIVIAAWEKRQYASDSSTSRVKKFRERQKNQGLNDQQTDETLQKRSSNGLEQNRTDTEKNREEKKKATAQPTVALPDWLPIDSWNGYLDMRKKKRKEPTARAIELLIADLEKLRLAGQDVAAVLDKSTKNGWTDVYEIKADQNPRASPSGLGRAGQATAAAAQRLLEKARLEDEQAN